MHYFKHNPVSFNEFIQHAMGKTKHDWVTFRKSRFIPTTFY